MTPRLDGLLLVGRGSYNPRTSVMRLILVFVVVFCDFLLSCLCKVVETKLHTLSSGSEMYLTFCNQRPHHQRLMTKLYCICCRPTMEVFDLNLRSEVTAKAEYVIEKHTAIQLQY